MSTHHMITRRKSRFPELPIDVWDIIYKCSYSPWKEPFARNEFYPIADWIMPVLNKENFQFRECMHACIELIYSKPVFLREVQWGMQSRLESEEQIDETRCEYCGYSDEDFGCQCDISTVFHCSPWRSTLPNVNLVQGGGV